MEARGLSRKRRQIATGEQASEACPVEGRAGIGLAIRGDIAVARHVFDGISARNRANEPREHCVLWAFVRNVVRALELDADREIVAASAAAPVRFARMPCAPLARYELQQTSIATDEEMRGYAQRGDRGEVRICRCIKAVREEPLDAISVEPAGRQRNAVQDDQ